MQGGRNSAKKRIWVYEPEKKNIYGHLQFNLILVIKRLGHGVGRVDEYGSNGTEYRASETLIKATDKDGPEGADGIAVSSAPFQALAAHSQLSSRSLATLTESCGSLLLGKRIYWEIINIQNKARRGTARSSTPVKYRDANNRQLLPGCLPKVFLLYRGCGFARDTV